MRRHLVRGGLVAVALAAPAQAHVTVAPSASRPGDLQEYRVLVPNEETDQDTVGVDIQLPAGVDSVLAEAIPGWTARVRRVDDQPRIVSYRGGRIPPDGYLAFHLEVRNPVRAGVVTFKALQRYEDETVRWIGPPNSDTPAPRVTLSDRAGAARPAPAAAADAGDDDPGRDGLTLGVAIAALALGGAALVRSRR